MTIGDSVTSIGGEAFGYCIALLSITIPASVISISNNDTFTNSGLTTVQLMSLDTETNLSISVGEGQDFFGATNVTILAPQTPTVFTNLIGNTFEANLTGELLKADYTDALMDVKQIKEVSIGSAVTSIGDGAFDDAFFLKSITIPNGVTSIGVVAFDNCKNLESITLPDSITSLGTSAFGNDFAYINTIYASPTLMVRLNYTLPGEDQDNTELLPISIPETVFFKDDDTIITSDITGEITASNYPAGIDKSNLKRVHIGTNVTSIGNTAFIQCSKLQFVNIPDSVTSIGISVFSACFALQSVTIPDSVTSIGRNAFSYCSALQSVTIPDSVTSIGTDAFQPWPTWH